MTVAPVPLAPRHVAGLVNLRGEVVTVVDVRLLLGLEARPSGVPPLHLVVTSRGDTRSLLVDEVLEVVHEGQGAQEGLPPGLHAGLARVASGVLVLPDVLVLQCLVPAMFDEILRASGVSESMERMS